MTTPLRAPAAAAVAKTNEGTSNSVGGVAILPSSAVCRAAVVGSAVPLNLTGVRAVRPLLLTPATYSQLEQTVLKLRLPTPPVLRQPKQEIYTSGEGSMAIKRNHKQLEGSDSDDLTGDDSASGDAWAKSSRTDVAVDYSIASSSQSSSESAGSQSTATRPANTPRRHTGPRKPRVHEKLTPEEEERRRTRRERNKYAAAKCRQKRVDLTNQLLAETEQLESEQAKLQDDIKSYQREKDELEFILEAHRLHCGIGRSKATATPTATAVAATSTGSEPVLKVQGSEGNVVFVVAGALHGASLSAASAASSALSSSPVASSLVKSEGKSGAARRPNSLLTTRLIASSAASQIPGSQVAGVSITTPSAGLNVYTLGLESMLDGHTGLTPITGLPIAGLSTPIFAIPASVAGVAVEETTSAGITKTSSDSRSAASTI